MNETEIESMLRRFRIIEETQVVQKHRLDTLNKQNVTQRRDIDSLKRSLDTCARENFYKENTKD